MGSCLVFKQPNFEKIVLPLFMKFLGRVSLQIINIRLFDHSWIQLQL